MEGVSVVGPPEAHSTTEPHQFVKGREKFNSESVSCMPRRSKKPIFVVIGWGDKWRGLVRRNRQGGGAAPPVRLLDVSAVFDDAPHTAW